MNTTFDLLQCPNIFIERFIQMLDCTEIFQLFQQNEKLLVKIIKRNQRFIMEKHDFGWQNVPDTIAHLYIPNLRCPEVIKVLQLNNQRLNRVIHEYWTKPNWGNTEYLYGALDLQENIDKNVANMKARNWFPTCICTEKYEYYSVDRWTTKKIYEALLIRIDKRICWNFNSAKSGYRSKLFVDPDYQRRLCAKCGHCDFFDDTFNDKCKRRGLRKF